MIKKLILQSTRVVLFLAVFNPAHAAIITYGSLTTNDDGSTNIITDTLNNYEWLRFDVLAPLTYAETLSALDTQDGGGWMIAGQTQAVQFLDALFNPVENFCTTSLTGTTGCGLLPSYTDGDLGNNSFQGSDQAWFESDTGNAGKVAIFDDAVVIMSADGITISETNEFSSSGSFADQPVTWLVYRDVSQVPVPPAVILFSTGLLGLIGAVRRKHRV